MPHHFFKERLLPHAPGIEAAERANDVGHQMPATGARRRHAGVRKDCVNMHGIKARDLPVEPARQWPRITESLAPLSCKKDRLHALKINCPAKLDGQTARP